MTRTTVDSGRPTANSVSGSSPALPAHSSTSPELGDLANICRRLEEDFAALAGKTVVLTGGAGFLGYYLIRSILHHNAISSGPAIDLWACDNFQRGMPEWLTRLEGTPHFQCVDHDVTHHLPADFPNAAYILHAASIASPSFYRSHPIETMDANVIGLRRLLDHCRDRAGSNPVQGLLFFSTSEIYGDPSPDQIPTPETYRGLVSSTGPRACYDESKRYGETLCVNFHRHHGVPAKIVRPFNNYGPGLKITDRRLIPDFARCVLDGEDIVMFSDGSPTRTFCYIADAVVGYYRVLVRGRAGEAYNIGCDRPEVSVAELARQMVSQAGSLFGYRGEVVHRPSDDPDYLVDNPNRRCPSIEKARSELGFEPEVSLEEGLRRSLLWYQNHPTAAVG